MTSSAPPPLPITAHSPDNARTWTASPQPAPAAAASSSSSSSSATQSQSQSRAKLNPAKFGGGQMPKFVSFEYFPPRTSEGTMNLMRRIETMGRKLKPLFVDLTTSRTKRVESLEICAEALMFCGVNVMLHVLCAEETKPTLRELLDLAKARGIRNLMVLKGDVPPPPPGAAATAARGDFARASDMIGFIRHEYGDYFCIACACYPESSTPQEHEDNLLSLLDKQRAGAAFAITQLFFDVQVFFQFERECRARGVTIPLLPGIMPIQLYSVFARTVKYLGTSVPQSIWAALEPIQHDDAAVREFGINLALDMSQQLLQHGAPGVHFFTHNLERSVTRVVEQLCTSSASSSSSSPSPPVAGGMERGLPWKQSVHDKRANEDVRPIFWSNKPNSYIARTQAWDEFPNGRWGDASSPAYGDLEGGSHFYATQALGGSTVAEKKLAWGSSPLSVRELAEVFVRFMLGEIDFLPWSETAGLALETGEISQTLVQLNRQGFLTINSQPRVNALPSSHGTFGWGPNNGIVYQKAYVEFFVCEEGVRALVRAMEAEPDRFGSLAFHACNARGDEIKMHGGDGPCAVTWGVFPHREILQPTIVDPVSFRTWKDEAFALWVKAWAAAYDEDSPSYGLIWDVHDTFWLVNIVDNDFIKGDIFSIFALESVKQAASLGLQLRAQD